MSALKVVVFLRWPEKCFRADKSDLDYLRALLPRSAVVVEATSERAFLSELPDATHAIVWYFKREWFAKAPKLKALATPAAGHELVPTEGPKGVKIHFGGYHGQIIAESVVGFMLAWSRGFFLPQLKTSLWPRTEISDSVHRLAGTTAVILGYGRIGRAIGEKLKLLGVNVQGVTRHNGGVAALLRGLSPNKRGLSPSKRGLSPDWLILALPSDTGTDNLVNAELLKKLPKKCVLINIGRGNSVDEVALARALRKHELAGAYLDVLKYEPHYRRCEETDPRVVKSSMALMKTVPGKKGTVPNCFVTPHASAFTSEYVKMCFDELANDGFWK